MKCRCGGETTVLDSRPGPLNSVKRVRACVSCGLRVKTLETDAPVDLDVLRRHRKTRRDSARRTWAKLTPEQRYWANKRKKLRQAARREARRSGEPVAQIYVRWGCV
jgi:transcriptional regulator NrdR family protein